MEGITAWSGYGDNRRNTGGALFLYSALPPFRKDRTIMNKMKREDIDNMVLESMLETGSDDILSKFSENLNGIISELEENKTDLDSQVTILASCIETAQMNAISTMRNVLYKIFCEDNEEYKSITTGGNKHDINQ